MVESDANEKKLPTAILEKSIIVATTFAETRAIASECLRGTECNIDCRQRDNWAIYSRLTNAVGTDLELASAIAHVVKAHFSVRNTRKQPAMPWLEADEFE